MLDDDTVIEQRELDRLAASLESCDLATGLPVFMANRTVFEQLVGGFVNGNAALTYFPAASAGIAANDQRHGLRVRKRPRCETWEASKR